MIKLVEKALLQLLKEVMLDEHVTVWNSRKTIKCTALS